MAADRAKTIGFEWDGNTYVFEAGRFSYLFPRDAESFQLESYEHFNVLNRLDMIITIYLGYLNQQLNAGTGYGGFSGAPAVGVVDVLNALDSEEVFYYPMLEDNDGNSYSDKYRVIHADDNNIELLSAARAGRFTPYVPVRLKCKIPLQEYPAWANR